MNKCNGQLNQEIVIRTNKAVLAEGDALYLSTILEARRKATNKLVSDNSWFETRPEIHVRSACIQLNSHLDELP
jgi:hypothetical protein